MTNDRKIVYTDSAKVRLEKFHLDIQEQVERYFQERKFVPGDEFIEITASDVEELSQKIRISRPTRSSPVKTLIPVIYTFTGVIFIAVGLFYEQFKLILEGDPKRLVFIAGGLAMILASWLSLYIFKARERKEQLERHYYELKNKLKSKPLSDEE